MHQIVLSVPLQDLTQQTMICTWLTEIFLDNLNTLEDSNSNSTSTQSAGVTMQSVTAGTQADRDRDRETKGAAAGGQASPLGGAGEKKGAVLCWPVI